MQLICGQCGKLSTMQGASDEVSLLQCPVCDHTVEINFFLPETDEPFFAEEGELIEEDGDIGYAQLAERALQERILVICAACGSKMRIARRLAGQKIKCVSCSKQILIPRVYSEDEDDLEGIGLKIGGFDEPALASIAKEVRKSSREKKTTKYSAKKVGMFAENPHLKYYVMAGVVAFAVLLIIVIGHAVISSMNSDETKSGAGKNGILDTSRSLRHVRKVSIVDQKTSMFASGSSCPAMPGSIYCHLSVSVSAGSSDLEFRTFGDSAMLEIDGNTYESLGEVVSSAIPVKARKSICNMYAGVKEQITLLFEIPERSGKGRLRLKGFEDNLQMEIVLPSSDIDPDHFIGEYVEAGRNLKPLLRDNVMRAIQLNYPSTLSIRKDGGNALQLLVPGAGVSGANISMKGNLWEFRLKKGTDSIRCRALLLPNERGKLILYLRNEPMYQIVYRRKET